MADNKKSFILYADLIHTVNELTDAEAGMLFKIVLDYVNDLNPTVNDRLLKLVFEPIKRQLKRDLKEWEDTRLKRSEAGRTGGLHSGIARSKTKQNEATVPENKQTQANEAVTVTVTDNVTVTDTVNDNDINKYELPLLKCVEIALLDEKYARLNKLVGPADFEPFIEKLETEGCYLKTPIDFKAHFARWKKKQPIAPKEIPIRPIREQDKWF
jgi:hypothetical protein